MNISAVLLLALGLSLDAFAVAIVVGCSARKIRPHHVMRLAFAFGASHTLMVVVGWLAGRGLHQMISTYDHWIAFGLLVGIGAKMVWESRGLKEPDEKSSGIPSGFLLFGLVLGTTVDTVAAGISLAMIRVSIWYPGAIIGLVCLAMTIVGVRIGFRVGAMLGRYAHVVGGVILCGLGVKILCSHLCGS